MWAGFWWFQRTRRGFADVIRGTRIWYGCRQCWPGARVFLLMSLSVPADDEGGSTRRAPVGSPTSSFVTVRPRRLTDAPYVRSDTNLSVRDCRLSRCFSPLCVGVCGFWRLRVTYWHHVDEHRFPTSSIFLISRKDPRDRSFAHGPFWQTCRLPVSSDDGRSLRRYSASRRRSIALGATIFPLRDCCLACARVFRHTIEYYVINDTTKARLVSSTPR